MPARNGDWKIRLLEGLGCCAAQLDEIEKGVSGEHDGRAAQRGRGIFLKWLSEHRCPVYVVASGSARGAARACVT